MVVNAVCVFMGTLLGSTIYLQQQDANSLVRVYGELRNLAAGDHGFHIHQYGDIRNQCLNASSHYNPFNKNHGGPDDEVRHVGDLGNVAANSAGIATIDQQFKLVQLQGEYSVIGRSLVVHSGVDDLGKGGNEESLKTGNAGSRLDCCVIGLI